MKLIIVNDNKQFRMDLKYFIENELSHTVIHDVNNGKEFLEIKNITDADIILMDLNIDMMDGFITTQKILWLFPDLKIIALTMNTKEITLNKLIETGFKGIISKIEMYNNLEAGLHAVYSGKLFFPDVNICDK